MKKIIELSGHQPDVVDFSKLVVDEGAKTEDAKKPAQKGAAHAKKEEVKQDVH